MNRQVKCCDLIFTAFDLPLDQIMFTQNKVLAKVILKLITVNLMIYSNSIKLREASITLTSFVQKRKNYSDFLCMNAMHTSGFSLLLSSNAGMLQNLPLKINFVPEVQKL